MHFAIVSYTFPPSKEIGGRRWAKFSQQLAKYGHKVTVICANELVSSDWYSKEFPGIEFKLLPKCYPNWLTGFTRSFKEKLLYMFYVRIWSWFTKQNLFDKGYAWKASMLGELENVHKDTSIDVMVVTGAPFSLLLYGAEFKQKHKEIYYITDLRDPWTWGSYYGMPTLSIRKRKYQEFSERRAAEVCDMMCFPTEHMGNFLKKKYSALATKMYLLPHAYDPDKFSGILKDQNRHGFIYGGTLYDGIEEYLQKLDKIIKKDPSTDFKWDIYTGTNYPLIDSNFASGKVKLHPLIPEDQLFQKIATSAAYLAFFPRADKDLVSTKFFEIIYTKTPIIYIGEEGDVGKFVRENKIGVHILPEHMERELPKYLTGNIPHDFNYFDVTRYTFSSVTGNLLKAIDQRRDADTKNKTAGTNDRLQMIEN